MDVMVGEEVKDIKMMTIEIDGDQTFGEASVKTYDNRNRSRTRERSLAPRRNYNRRHDSPNENLGTRNRSNSRVTTNRHRIRCYRCKEYDHFANECPNAVTDGSDGYESDRTGFTIDDSGSRNS